ncbi:MAG: ImmA/IrrE family metallo-endopeptidase [Saprospiraceae bacterium]|nr:ImmA/IrrE family metallo-endopeptidase [Saprospiraceae bacterium]
MKTITEFEKTIQMAFSPPLDRSLLSPPGDTIRETIESLGMTQAELSARMGRPKEKINELINGKAPLTMDTAIMLERVLGIPVHFWIRRESIYRETLARIEEKEALELDLRWLDQFPLKTMHKLGVISSSKSNVETLREVLRFFRFAAPKDWNAYYLGNSTDVAFRISLKNTPSPATIAVWLRLGERQLASKSLTGYNARRFKESMLQFREIAHKQPDSFLQAAETLAASCGVALVFTPGLPNTKISGAARWIHQTPLIQLSDLYKTNDQFWFSFFHEACHILKHSKKALFLENTEGVSQDLDKEREANEYAANLLIPKDAYHAWKNSYSHFDEQIIRHFARDVAIHPGIVVGRLQHDGLLKPAFHNQLKVRVRFE